jgi:hypothetical protein
MQDLNHGKGVCCSSWWQHEWEKAINYTNMETFGNSKEFHNDEKDTKANKKPLYIL